MLAKSKNYLGKYASEKAMRRYESTNNIKSNDTIRDSNPLLLSDRESNGERSINANRNELLKISNLTSINVAENISTPKINEIIINH